MSIKSATLPKGTFVKLQPHTKDFLDISNPKAVLERTLRGYACLTKGDTICLPYNNKKYFIDVIEARPQVSISRTSSQKKSSIKTVGTMFSPQYKLPISSALQAREEKAVPAMP